MTFRIARSFVIAAFLVICALPQSANAELSLAVVDVEGILSQSKAAKSIQRQVDDKRKDFLSDVKEREDALRSEQKEIESQRSDLSKEELMEKAQKFEKQRIKAKSEIHEKKGKLDKAYAEAMQKLTKTIYDVCKEIADEKEIDLVITRQNIIVGNLSLDITKEVLDRMNRELPELKLSIK